MGEKTPSKEEPTSEFGKSHSIVASLLTLVYSQVKPKPLAAYSGASLQCLHSWDITYKSMDILHNALRLGSHDVFYVLGSGDGKLPLYMALRGDAASSTGIELDDSQHLCAQEAGARLRRQMLPAAESGETSRDIDGHLSFTFVHDDIRCNLYQDATVVVMFNRHMAQGLQKIVVDHLVKSSQLRCVACITSLPPHSRLHSKRSLNLPCVNSKLQSWRIYEVLPLLAPSLLCSGSLRNSKLLKRTSTLPTILKVAGAANSSNTVTSTWRDGRQNWLLPSSTPNLLCNWSPVSKSTIDTLIIVLQEVLGTGGACSGTIYDLGCGDGRVVHEVVQALPGCRGVGVDLNAALIEWAQNRARKGGLVDRLDFRVADLADVDLSEAVAIFLYLPLAALSFCLKKVFPVNGLRKGTAIFSADGPLPGDGTSSLFNRLELKTLPESMKSCLHCYAWQGRKSRRRSQDGQAIQDQE